MPAPATAEKEAARPRIGGRHDPEEREADRLAAALTAPSPQVLGCSACGAEDAPCAACAAGARSLRRSPLGPAPSEAPSSVAAALAGPGEALPATARTKFERRLGTDLSGVRLLTGPAAARAARDINAVAFAFGRDIAFGGHAPSPHGPAGEHLLAHEVAHTLEGGPPVLRRRDYGAEAEAKDFKKDGQMAAPREAPKPVDSVSVYDKIRAIVGTKEGEGNTWVGPLDEYSLEALWGSLGDQVLTDLKSADKRTLWDRSIDKGAELHKIPAMRKLQTDFITAVANVACGYLDENKATAKGEKDAIGSDPASAPTPKQTKAIDERRQASENYKRARMAQTAMRTYLYVGYDRMPGHYSLIGSSKCHPIANEPGNFNLVVKPFNPDMPPMLAPRGDECIPMPTHAATLEFWKKMTAVQEGEISRFPALYALGRDLDEEEIASSKPEATNETARTRMLAAMDQVIANIDETYPRLAGHLPYELNPIHRQLFAKAPWNAGIEGETAHALVKEYEDAEFWRSMGLAAVQMALFVVATLATGGLAIVAFGAAAGIGIGQAANSIRKWEELDAANRTNLSDETALVSSGQVGGALFAAVLDTAFAFLDAYQAVKGAATAARGVRGVAGAAPATLEAATEAELKTAAEAQAKVAEKAAPDLSKRLSTPGAARIVEDEGLRRAGYKLEVEVEQEGEKHIFRQRADGTWCRFSTRLCGLVMGPEVERAAQAALREAAAPLEVAATKGAVEGVAHQAPKLLEASRIGTMVGKLGAKFPVLRTLTPGAIERIVRAGFAQAEGGGLRRALRWPSAVRGQLLEEIAAQRVRGLLATAEGRAAMGLEREATDLIFIEGSRIRDAAGLQITDGVIARRIGDRIEIVAVLESKAGSWAAGGLTEGLQGLKRMGLEDIMEGVRQGGALSAIQKIDPSLVGQLEMAAIAKLDDAGKLALRERVMAALGQLPESDLKGLKKMMQTGEGQVSRDIERLMTNQDRTLELQIHDGSGKAVKVTTQMPKRPRFLGAVPSDVATDDIAKQLSKDRFDFGKLEMGDMDMARDEMDKLARAIIGDLGTEFETSANAAAKAGGATPAP